jgi:hypothetical protein
VITTPKGNTVQPGDFAVVRMAGTTGALIRIAEKAALDLHYHRIPKKQRAKLDLDFEHAITYIGVMPTLGGLVNHDMILEAEPGGARVTAFHYNPDDVLWSTDNPTLDLNQVQRQTTKYKATYYKNTPYSYLDYVAQGDHRLGIPFPRLRTYIEDTGHMICSQCVDQVRQDQGSHLFNDERWPGYVDPLDLAILIQGGM